jgi:hypothetical protein
LSDVEFTAFASWPSFQDGVASGALDVGWVGCVRAEHGAAVSALSAAGVAAPRAIRRTIDKLAWDVGELSLARGERLGLAQLMGHGGLVASGKGIKPVTHQVVMAFHRAADTQEDLARRAAFEGLGGGFHLLDVVREFLEIDLPIGGFPNSLAGAGDGGGEPDEELPEGLRAHVIHAEDDIGDPLEHGVIHIHPAADTVNIRRAGANGGSDALERRAPVVAGLAIGKQQDERAVVALAFVASLADFRLDLVCKQGEGGAQRGAGTEYELWLLKVDQRRERANQPGFRIVGDDTKVNALKRMRIAPQGTDHGAESAADGFDSLPDHGFRAVDKEIYGEAADHDVL